MRLVGEPDSLDRLCDGARGRRRAKRPNSPRTGPAGGDHLAHGHRRVDSELGALGEVPIGSGRGSGRGLPEERDAPLLRPLRPTMTRSSVVLPPPFGPAIATNSPGVTAD